MSRSRRVDWREARKLCALAVAAAAACLAAALALLALTGPAIAGTVAPVSAATATVAGAATTATLTAQTVSCFPLSESSSSCYNAGEFCPNADLNKSGVAADGAPIACESPPGGQQPRWEACTPVTFPATPGSAATQAATTTATQVCPPTPAGAPTGAATPGANAGAPTGAPATGGGRGPGSRGTLAVAGGAVMAAGAGLILLSRWRTRRRPV